MVQMLAIWMEIKKAEYFKGLDLSEYLEVFHVVRRINNEDILMELYEVFNMIESEQENIRFILEKIAVRRYKCNCRVLSMLQIIRAKLRKERIIEDGKDISFELTSLLD